LLGTLEQAQKKEKETNFVVKKENGKKGDERPAIVMAGKKGHT